MLRTTSIHFFYKFKRDFNLNLRLLGYLLKPVHVNIIPSSISIDPIEKKVLENELLYIILTSKKDIA